MNTVVVIRERRNTVIVARVRGVRAGDTYGLRLLLEIAEHSLNRSLYYRLFYALKSVLSFLATRALTQLRNRLTVRGKKLASPFGWSFHSAETPHPALSEAFRGVSVAFLHPASYQEAPAPPDRPR